MELREEEEKAELYDALVNTEGGLSLLQQLLKQRLESFEPIKNS